MTYIDIIDESYNATLNYDNASLAYNQYMAVNPKVERLLQDAWKAITAIQLHFPAAQQLTSAIQAQAKADNVQL